jgi:gluconolactonase
MFLGEPAVNDLNDLTRRRLLQATAGGLAFVAETRSSFGAAAGVIQRQQATAPPLPGPYPRIERLAPELDDVVTGEVEIVARDIPPSLEGPLWSKKDGGLLICNGGKRLLYTPGKGITTNKENVQGGGLTLDPQGRIVATGGTRIRREEPDGSVTTIVDNYKGVPLNGTNDLCIHTDGSIYFTDPTFTPKQLGFNGVYRVTPDGKQLDLLTDEGGSFPNGIALSPDEKTLYVCSGIELAVFAWNVLPNGLIDKASKRVAADVRGTGAPGRPDGFKVDSKGNIHTSGSGGQWIVSPAGKPLGIVVTEEFPINCAFGGDDWKTLYYVTRSTVVAVKLKIAGEPVPMKRS